jgi:hypothetical protein
MPKLFPYHAKEVTGFARGLVGGHCRITNSVVSGVDLPKSPFGDLATVIALANMKQYSGRAGCGLINRL